MSNELGTSSAPMLSFPSTFNSGGDGLVMVGASTTQTSKFNSTISSKSDFSSAISQIKTKNISLKDVRQHYYAENAMNISTYDSMLSVMHLNDSTNSNVYYEDPYHFPSMLLREMNLYRFMYKNASSEVLGVDGNGEDSNYHIIQTAAAPSLFNPKYNVQVIGMTHNVPLLNDQKNRGLYAVDDDVSDCSVRKLIELSHNDSLGQQKYRLADFIFCKDYGKVSNNHLITLRKFGLPIGDIIGKPASTKYSSAKTHSVGTDNTDDVARLVAWFGTDDNNLSDILKYSYQYTWKQLNSDIQREEGQDDNTDRGPLGMIANMNPTFSKHVNMGTASAGMTLFGLAGSSTASFNRSDSSALARLRFIDKNKVYEPLQTIQDNNIPEGKLIFTNEFTLTFSYKLRAYDNINPKSAFLDLLANIHECTYFRGKFWGGRRQVIGPGINTPQYEKAYKFIDNAFDKIGGGIKSLVSGGINIGEFFGTLSSLAPAGLTSALNKITDTFKNEGFSEGVKKIIDGTIDFADKNGLADVLKGQLKNALGRPAFYAFHSLLTDNLYGLWHVTIGNPRNPIVSMGNLILTNSEVQHMGPLGLDDFPTELKVICTLKPAMSRDLTGIQKMYTQGVSGIYLTRQYNKLSNQLLFPSAWVEQNIDDLEAKRSAATQDSERSLIAESIDNEATKRQLDMVDKQSRMSTDADSMGLVQNELGMQIHQLGTPNLFKLQISMDEITAPTV